MQNSYFYDKHHHHHHRGFDYMSCENLVILRNGLINDITTIYYLVKYSIRKKVRIKLMAEIKYRCFINELHLTKTAKQHINFN